MQLGLHSKLVSCVLRRAVLIVQSALHNKITSCSQSLEGRAAAAVSLALIWLHVVI